MNRVTTFVGIAVLAIVAGCAQKEAPAAHEEDEGATPAAAPAAAPAAQPQASVMQPMAKDRSRAAADMIAFIDPTPQCQQYIDQLEALGRTPGSIDDLSGPYVAAHQAGCVIKKQQQQQQPE